MSAKWHRLLADGLTMLGLGLALGGLLGVGATNATPQNGTIKVHTEANCSGSDNDPKVGDQFWISGEGFTSGTERWVAVTDGVNASDPIIIGPYSVGTSGSFCVGPYSLSAGHYKVYVGTSSNVVTNNEKINPTNSPSHKPESAPPSRTRPQVSRPVTRSS